MLIKRLIVHEPKHVIKIGILIILVFMFDGCYKDKAEKLYPGSVQCDTLNMKYSVNVSPILTGNCATSSCHTTSNKANAGGYAFDSYSETMLAVPNKKLMNSINHISGTSPMPKNGAKLPRCDINRTQAWINQGALNN